MSPQFRPNLNLGCFRQTLDALGTLTKSCDVAQSYHVNKGQQPRRGLVVALRHLFRQMSSIIRSAENGREHESLHRN